MAPLLPSESAAYSVALPEETDDDRLNLKLRTGASATYTRSTVVVHGGLTLGLPLPTITVAEIESQIRQTLGVTKDWNNYLSNEIFYLSIINRKWNRVQIPQGAKMPRPRLFHSLTFNDNAIYMFGGLGLVEGSNKFVALNDMWRFNIADNAWECLDDGDSSGTVSRYDHTMQTVDYISPLDHQSHRGLAIIGGRGELNQELMHISIYDLATSTYLNNTEIQLTLNELKPADTTHNGRKGSAKGARAKLKVTTSNSFVISGTSSLENDINDKDDVLYIFSQEGIDDANLKNPIISLPAAPNASGIRLGLADNAYKNKSVVPRGLKHPTGGMFGSNIIVSGQNEVSKEYQVYSYNRPSQKWTRLSIDSKLKAKDMYLWRSFSWHSHHKVLVLGSAVFPKGAECGTIQKFDLLVLVGLPITNIFHAFSSKTEASNNEKTALSKMSIKQTTSFEAYSKYMAPTTKISSIRSVFPSYAVTLGRNAFERYGASLADFEFITADGDKINVPLMLLRKRWGRCFDMLLAKGYARAVYKLENSKDEDDEEGVDAPDVRSTVSSTHQSKKSLLMLNKASQQADRQGSDAPQFRLPFQDKNGMTPLTSISSGSHLTPGSVSTSRKASVVSTSGASVNTTSTADLPDGPDFSSLPPATPPPTDPLPSIDVPKPSLVKSMGSRDYLRDSPRGSVSGTSMATSIPSAPPPPPASAGSAIKMKDLRCSVNQLKKRGTSRSSAQNNSAGPDDLSTNDALSGLESIHTDNEGEDETKNLLEPLLIPRSLYLPFSTSTVQAITEFLFVGKLGDRWLLTPTTTDTFLVAKFYELPLLYDLISEALYAVLGRKEDALMKNFGKLVETYEKKVNELFHGDEDLVRHYFEEHPHVKEEFNEIEGYFATVDDGFLNLALLRKAGKGSSYTSTVTSSKNSVDMTRRRSSAKARVGKSSLSKEVKADEDDEDSGKKEQSNSAALDDIENEAEEEYEEDKPLEPIVRAGSKEPIKFRTDSMSQSLKSPRKLVQSNDDEIDPITPLAKVIDATSLRNNESAISDDLDDEDPLSSRSKPSDSDAGPRELDPASPQATKSSESEQEPAFAVPEGNFKISKGDKLVKVKSNSSSSSQKGNKTTTTSDSDEMTIGLGLVTNLKKKKQSRGINAVNRNADNNDDGDDDDDEESNLPTLEHLASPNSPEPSEQVIQVIYEAAALACDMKLLLRSVNALELSKTFNHKSDALMKELNTYVDKFEAERLRREQEEKERIQKEQRERERAQREFEETECMKRELALRERQLEEQAERERRQREEEEMADVQAQLVKGEIAPIRQSSKPVLDRHFSPMESNGGAVTSNAATAPRKVSSSGPTTPGQLTQHTSSPGPAPTYSSGTPTSGTPQKSLRAALSSANVMMRGGSVSGSNSSSGGSDTASIGSKRRGFMKSFSSLNLGTRKVSSDSIAGAIPATTTRATYNERVNESRAGGRTPEKKKGLFGLLSRKGTSNK